VVGQVAQIPETWGSARGRLASRPNQAHQPAASVDVALFDPDLENLKDETARPLPEGIDTAAIKRDLECAQSAHC
jgi:hypothetical protein